MKKSFISLLVTGMAGVMSLASCGGGGTPKVDKPDYSKYRETNIMDISGWVAPAPANWNNTGNPEMINDKGYKQIKDCGFTSIYALYEFLSSSYTAKAAELAGKYGIKYYARDTGNITGDPIADGYEPGDIRNRAYVQAYCNKEGFAGHLATDEPSIRQFTQLGHLKEFYETEFPGKEFYVNLFPCYANVSQLGCDTYEEYISSFIDKVNPQFLSYDHYALEEDQYGHVKYTSSVLYNHLVVAKLASEAGIPYGNFTQTLKFSNASRTIKKESELRWQILTDMAYGCTRVQYFTYVTPLEWTKGFQEGLVDREGNPTATYFLAQSVNNMVASMDEAYLNYKWKGTMLVDGEYATGNMAFDMVRDDSPKSVPGMSKIEASLDTLVGQFDSKVDNCKGYMITNFSEPSYDSNVDTISATFPGMKKALVYNQTEMEEVSLNNGVLSYDIGAGDGIFVIPFNN